ncbi:putative short transient receptor potential channel 2-like protein isoform X4 [Molossus molossus]|uniref:putative short transient receptor potential channel 2-like protein isoform X4 n=1 Tax=Molossus molossus TaxID=27622 RepID=UPI001746932A|nr:putative short transient receptor potential channel 2-like protein isoform X4 [Molossus molossus]
MAPVKISHVVSFSSQDPKYPVENLLNPDRQRGPWLSCPQDKSGQLKLELQLERAVPIGYIDVGNCGCAFLQIDVGRSSWSLDRPFVTLLPATMLMSLADSKQGKNRSGVRMFKEDDFLAPALSESWDRLRLTCSQPFTRHQSFGLAFLRVCSSLDSLDDPMVDPSAPVSSGLSQGSSNASESDPSPWMANPSIRRTFFPDPQTPLSNSNSQRNRRGRAKAGQREHHQPQTQTGRVQDSAECPICAGSFNIEILPQHAATCGETSPPHLASPSSSSPSSPSVVWVSSSESSSPISWVQCPICQWQFSAGEVEEHASVCGEVPQMKEAAGHTGADRAGVLSVWIQWESSSPHSIGGCSHGPPHGKRTSAPLPSPILVPFLAMTKTID